MACMTFGEMLSCCSFHSWCSRWVAGDIVIITTFVANGPFTGVVAEWAVTKDGVVMFAEAVSEVTVTELVVAVAKVVIDGAVTEETVAKWMMAGVAGDLVPALHVHKLWREEVANKQKLTVKVEVQRK